MDRRRFVGSLAAAAVVGGGAFAVDERRTLARTSGAAVGMHRPAGLTSTRLVWSVPTDQPVVALTFDDGPDPRYTPAILRELDRRSAVATFFMQGAHVAEHASIARLVAERHAVGNHSHSHPSLGVASARVARRELGETHDVIHRIVGREPALFRPPYGHFSGATSMMAAGLGYDIVLWSDRIDSHESVEGNLARLSRSIRPGAIVLGHDGGGLPNDTVVQVLPGLLDQLAQRGIRTVTVLELLSLGGRSEPVAATAGA